MSLRDDAIARHPDFPWLDLKRPHTLRRLLAAQGWLEPGESVVGCERAGEGNMNLTVRVRTDRRELVLKQSRPWVEKYDDIAAPWDRILSELRFYERAGRLPTVATRLPRVIAASPASRTLLLEYVPGARDLAGAYADGAAAPGEAELRELGTWLGALHAGTRGRPEPALPNRDMRELNRQHVFAIPLSSDAPVDLEALEPGLSEAVAKLAADAAYRARVSELEARYLADGPCLLHGDFFPGSWLRSDVGLRIIDPEFAFDGDPEWDLGVAIAHLALARRPGSDAGLLRSSHAEGAGEPADPRRLAGFAGVEVMRRLAGVAQLPIPPSGSFGGPPPGWRAALLSRSRDAVVSGEVGALFGD